MSVAARPVKTAEPEKDWEDEYVRLRAQFTAQKQLCNEQEDHIRKYFHCDVHFALFDNFLDC